MFVKFFQNLQNFLRLELFRTLKFKEIIKAINFRRENLKSLERYFWSMFKLNIQIVFGFTGTF